MTAISDAYTVGHMDRATTAERIGHRIREFRLAHRLTQVELAERLCISQPSVSQWERGETFPTLALQRALADELNTRRRFLFAELVEAEDHGEAA